ncbi:MAG: integration host factor subunit alpha [Deltaproteobacteria bacterium]|nr:integration host factor subunit alpha [Deltaproteobacteria bacterium]
MTKSDLADRLLASGAVSTKAEAHDIVEAVFAAMKDALASGEDVKLSRFGNFVVRDKVARLGRNPQTGEEITLDGRRVVRFRGSQVMKTSLEKG